MNIRTFSPILLLAAMLVQPCAHAGENKPASTRSETALSQCAEGVAGCVRGAAADEHRGGSVRHEPPQSCAPDAQDCDTRGKSQRDRAAAEMRDRHACRD